MLGRRYFLCWIVMLAGLVSAGCDEDGPDRPDGGGHGSDDISMITPFVSGSDIASVNEAFSSTDNAPWGFRHLGIDFFPAGQYKPFQAVAPGIVEAVELKQNEVSSNWQVNVRIRANTTYGYEYAFEPMSAVAEDGTTQRANIVVSVGQDVAPGDLVGNLLVTGSDSHVDFGLLQNWTRICPESYFTPEARDSVLSVIHDDHPTWNMCY